MSVNRTSWPAPATPLGVLEHGGITTFSHLPVDLGLPTTLTTTTNWPAANLAIYTPIEVHAPFLVAKIAWWNGSTVAGNVDAGIYSVAGTLLAGAGATAQSGTNVAQAVDITDYLLMPGNYYLGILNSSTGRISYSNISTSAAPQCAGLLQEATGGTLPAAMTPATYAQTLVPLVALLADTRIA